MIGKDIVHLNRIRKVAWANYARLAQSVEHETLNLGVVASSPTLGEVFFGSRLNSLSFYIYFSKPITDIEENLDV